MALFARRKLMSSISAIMDPKVLEFLTRVIESGEDDQSFGRQTPIYQAVSDGDYNNLAEVLQINSTDLSHLDQDGYSPLHLAVLQRDITSVRQLCDSGADAQLRDLLGNSPLHLAVESAIFDRDIVQTLLEYGADVNSRDLKGRSVQHCTMLQQVVAMKPSHSSSVPVWIQISAASSWV